MAGVISFHYDVLLKNSHVFPELAKRAANFSPVFENVINAWAENNSDKFGMGEGMEASGVAQDGFRWQALTPRYSARKRKEGFANWLMVRTGELLRSLTNPEGFFRFISADSAVFGTPKDPEDAAKVRFNWPGPGDIPARRQAVFLSQADQKSVITNATQYLNLGENYKDILFASGLEASKVRAMSFKMDQEFSAVVA